MIIAVLEYSLQILMATVLRWVYIHAMETLNEVRNRYYKELTENIMPFWLEHGLDRKNGGIWTSLDRDGSLIETDKSVWFQGRALWVFSTAYLKFGKKEYLEAADNIVGFIDKHCFDTDGRMFFRVTADGRPVIKRIRYFFSETFAIIGYASYGRASGKTEYVAKAAELYERTKAIRDTPGILTPKFDSAVRPMRGHADSMIMINVISELREASEDCREYFNAEIDREIEACIKYFIRPDMKTVLETVGPDGEFLSEHFEGRIVNPGHAIEGSWFIMNEGLKRGNEEYIKIGLDVLSWMWDAGWDDEYGGGIIQYRDALGKSLSEYHQDMKFWWPQCEAVISNLMAYSITHDDVYLEHFKMVDEYISKHFIDREYGEWFGYFHRDGTLATALKGNLYKGPFHIPRMYMKAIEIIDSL